MWDGAKQFSFWRWPVKNSMHLPAGLADWLGLSSKVVKGWLKDMLSCHWPRLMCEIDANLY